MTEHIIPIFYACDDNFVKYTVVSMHSMIKNASKDYKYHIYILHTGISPKMMEKVYVLMFSFINSKILSSIGF